MKYKVLYLLVFVLFMSCNKDESNYFDVDLTDLQIEFEPIPGGAYAIYKLPQNTKIYAIQARYKDLNGKDMLVKGTYTANKMKLFGFNEAQTNVPVEISLIDRYDNTSDIIHKTFSTQASAAVSVFDKIEVKSGWNGFRIQYPGLGEETQGILNIYTLGLDPKTQKIDTILLDTTPLQSTDFSYNYTGAADTATSCLVILRSDDFRGNIAKRVVYNDIQIERAEQINQEKLSLYSGSCYEDDVRVTGIKYLFDGDKIGWQALANTKSGSTEKFYAFMSVKEDEAVKVGSTKNVWTFDISEETEIASIRIYSQLHAKIPGANAGIFNIKEAVKWWLPNSLEIYATNNPDASIEECTFLGSYSEYQSLPDEFKWIYPAIFNPYSYTAADLDKFKLLDPNYLEVAFDITGNKYRYVKLKVLELFEYDINTTHYTPSQLYMEEFEVFKKKE